MEPNPFGDPPLDVQLRVCSEGAEAFVTQFYRDVNSGNSLSTYYIDANTLYAAANESSDIVINGAKLNSSAEYEALLTAQRGGPIPPTPTNGHHNTRRTTTNNTPTTPRVRYDVESFDAQPINHAFQIALPDTLATTGDLAHGGGCISMLVSVMGTLHLGDEQRKTFTEAFVLWPNWAARGRSASARREKNRFLIADQNYRTL